MKLFLLTAFLGFLTLTTQAQVITVVGTGTISGTAPANMLPGSSSNYIFFNGSTYVSDASVASDSPYSDLMAFKFTGGVLGLKPPTTSSITPPGGNSAISTGALEAATQNGAVYEMAVGVTPTPTNDPTFNYADFDVYVMYSNVDEYYKDSGILLETASAYSTDANNGFPVNSTLVTDNNTNLNSAFYVEYNVQGFTSSQVFVLGAETTSALGSFANSGYIGGVSFVSLPVPEPSTWAMLLVSLGAVGFCVRRKLA